MNTEIFPNACYVTNILENNRILGITNIFPIYWLLNARARSANL